MRTVMRQGCGRAVPRQWAVPRLKTAGEGHVVASSHRGCGTCGNAEIWRNSSHIETIRGSLYEAVGSMVVRNDWLVGGDRRTAAADRIYAAATDLIARDGFEAFDIDALAARVHCSRATIYRHAGGKAEIRDAVLVRAAAQIVETVRLPSTD